MEQAVHPVMVGVRSPNGAGAGGTLPAGATTETGGRVAAPGGTVATTGGPGMAGGMTRAGVARIGGRGD
eukprot:13555505-Alexandrium_andersonii.AAC.1